MHGYRAVVLFLVAALTAVAPLLSGSARALSGTSLVIWPIDPSIPSGHQATALWLENRGDRPLTLQVRVVGWTTVDFDEVFVGEQEAVIASPPIAEVPAGQKQLVRLVRVAPAPVGREQAFRVIVDELPRPDRPQTPATQVAIGVSLRLRYSLPLFVYGQGLVARREPAADGPTTVRSAMPDLHWRLVADDAATWLHVRNTGSGHARLSRVRVRAVGADAALSAGLLGYVLPDAERRWRLPEGFVGQNALLVDADVNGRDVTSVPVALMSPIAERQ